MAPVRCWTLFALVLALLGSAISQTTPGYDESTVSTATGSSISMGTSPSSKEGLSASPKTFAPTSSATTVRSDMLSTSSMGAGDSLTDLSKQVRALSAKVQKMYDRFFATEGRDKMLRNSSLPNQIQTVDLDLTDVDPVDSESTCGGFIDHFSSSYLEHTFPPSSKGHGCIWIVWTTKVGDMGITSVSEGNNTTALRHDLFIRTLSISPHAYINEDGISMDSTTHLATSYDYPFFLIYVYAQPRAASQRVSLHISKYSYGSSSSTLEPQLIQLDSSSTDEGTISHPAPPAVENGLSERFFILGKAAPGKQLNITLSDVSTEERNDWVLISWWDQRALTKKRKSEKFTGSGLPEFHLHLDEGVPFILMFKVDNNNNVNGKGFNLSYVYYDADA